MRWFVLTMPLVKFNYSYPTGAADACVAPVEHVLEDTELVLWSGYISDLQGRRKAAL